VMMTNSEWQESVEKLAGDFGNSHPVAAGVLPAQHEKVGAIDLNRLGGSGEPPLPRKGVSTAQIKTGVLSPLREDEGHYYAVAVMNKGKDRLKLATVAWLKEPLRSWLAKAETQVPVTMAAISANYTFPVIASPSIACTDDSWTATSTTGAPAARELHTAVWTGTEMIVWGGTNGTFFNTGGRYNPGTDSWTATSTTGAPAGRDYHTAVWTGSEMIVWGGFNGSYFNTGGRSPPPSATLSPTSTTGAPAGRYYHTAVWTGSEMIVWGGFNGSYFNTGGRYNPGT